MNKYIKHLLIIISALIFTILQMAFFNNLGLPYLFLIVITGLVLVNYRITLNFVLYFGLFIDLYNSKNFGLITISLLINCMVINYLFLNYFTHKNFLTYLILNICCYISFFIFLFLGQMLFSFIIDNYQYNIQDIIFLFKQLVITIIIFSILYFFSFIFKKLLNKYVKRPLHY